jgi:hypothetical protein
VYGVSLDEEWTNWIGFEREWEQANLDSIRRYPVTPSRPLSVRPLGSVSREFYDPAAKTLYAAVNYPGEFSHIAAIDVATGKIRKLFELSTPALYYVCSLAYDDSSKTLFFTTNNSKGYRNLESYSIATGKTERLIEYSRTGDLAFNRADKTLWGIQHHNGYSSIVRIPPPYKDGQVIPMLPYGKDLFDIDISPDGKHLTGTLASINGAQQLIRMPIDSLLAGDFEFEILHEFEKNPAQNFVCSSDGRYLYGTSYLTGVSNVFRYDLVEKRMEALSNAETGYFRPLPVAGDSVIVFSFTGKGFVPVMIPDKPIEDVKEISYLGTAVVEKYPELMGWTLGSPLDVNLDSLVTGTPDYHSVRDMRFTAAYPIAECYKTTAAVGMRANFMDPLWQNSVDVSLSYSPVDDIPENERLHFKVKYENWRWQIRGAYNRADFYDFFGPTKTSRKGYGVGVQFKGYPLSDGPRSLEYAISAAHYGGLEKMPLYQNIDVSYDNFYTAGASLRYKCVRGTIGAVEAEKGVLWSLNADNSIVLSELYPQFYATFDWGLLLPIDHSSLWLRTAAGYSLGDADESFANFYFGGFGNNWIDHAASVNRYREFYSFPGAELNAIGGTNFGKALLEWTLPPLRFKRIGVASLYANWARLALFTSAIGTGLDVGDEEWERKLMNVGAQLNLKVVIFTSLESTFSVGYARAMEQHAETADELMVSLKILR